MPTAKPTNESLYSQIPDYRDKLESKVREQARRLADLEKYRCICEKRIRQLSPNHPLPVKEEMLSIPVDDNMVINEEQKNYYDLLKKTIESELIKKGFLNKYITPEGVIDFAKIKSEADEYRRQLVLAQSMINSLKSDVEELTNENNSLRKPNVNLNIDEITDLKNQINTLTMKNQSLFQEKVTYDEKVSQLRYENENLVAKNKELSDNAQNVYKYRAEQSEEISKKLNEYKESYEKINQDFGKLLNEKNELRAKNIQLVNENQNYHNQLCAFEVQLDKVNSDANAQRENKVNEEYKKLYNELLIENSNLKNLLNKNVDKSFSISSNGNQITKLQSELSQLSIENEKIKIDLANLLKEKLDIEKENEGLKGKIKNLSVEKVKVALENEKISKKYILLEEKYEQDMAEKKSTIKGFQDEISKTKIQFDENAKQNINLSNEFEEMSRKFKFAHNQVCENEKKLSEAENEKVLLKTEKDRLTQKLIECETKLKYLNEQYKKLESENISMKKSENNLKSIVEQAENKVEETLQYNGRVNKEIEKLEREIEEKNKLILQYQKDKENYEREVREKLKIFDGYVDETKKNISSLLTELLKIATDFDKMSNQDLNSLFTKNFSQGISQILSQINSINNIVNYEVYLNDKLFFETISKFLSILSSELENVYDKFFDSNKYIKETFSRMNTLEEEMKVKAELKQQQASAEQREKEKEKNKEKEKDKDTLSKKFTILQTKNYELEIENDKLKQENKDLRNTIIDLNYKIKQSENKVYLVVESRKKLIRTIYNFIKSFPYKDMIRVMLGILNTTETIAKIELEKRIVEDKLEVIDKEYNELIKDKAYVGSDLYNILKKEQENLRGLKGEFEGKLNVEQERLKTYNENYEKYLSSLE